MIELLFIMGYGIMMGVTTQIMKYRSGEGDGWDWEEHPEITLSLMWPILLPAFLGFLLAKLVFNDGPSRIEKKRQREIEAARHTRRLEEELGIR